MNKTKINTIIHGASVSAAGVGAGLAQIPGSDMPILCGIQTTMILGIGSDYGISISESMVKDLILTYAAGHGGRAISQCLIGWIPGFGNAINASTAAAITEAIGWGAVSYFESQQIKKEIAC